ncbi:MAG: PilT/PilU family type 4a pilus ATPase [Thiohalocapsa sp.]
MDRQQAAKFMLDCLRTMLARNGSDLFISADFPPACKIDGKLTPLTEQKLKAEQTSTLVRSIMNDHQIREFDASKECNFAINPPGIGRFRVNVFVQQGRVGAVLRIIPTEIPKLEQLGLPPVLKDLILTKRGLILVVGGTGSGKSTSLAAMIGHRNHNTYGHIITIEDPVEFVHKHANCLITQREVGVDTESWGNALVNTLRQAPNVILIGEIRTRETMEHAINFSETGHLCLSTLHANSANQALDRIINLFPEERRAQLLMDLSLNLKAVISQRLLPKVGGGRVAAIEILINSPLIQDLIFKGKVHEIKEIMQKSKEAGMQTFDMALFDLYESGTITYEDAMRAADSMNELRLRIKLEGKDANERDALGEMDGLSILADDDDSEVPVDFGEDGAGDSIFELDADELSADGSPAPGRR